MTVRRTPSSRPSSKANASATGRLRDRKGEATELAILGVVKTREPLPRVSWSD